MAIDYVQGVFKITNMLIAIFILLYAYLFLLKTSRRQERKPWDYLFVSAFIFLLYQIFTLIAFFSDIHFWIFEDQMVQVLVEFLYSGLVLLAFVSQHDLILKSPLILISRKVQEEEEKIKEKVKEEEEKIKEKVKKSEK